MDQQTAEDILAYAALNALGRTADEIAATLANKGIRGHRGSMATCPLAKYLQTQGFDSFPIRFPNGALEFMRAFDCGRYPELEEG